MHMRSAVQSRSEDFTVPASESKRQTGEMAAMVGLWILGLVILLVLCYCVVPNLWIRVLRRGVVWRGPGRAEIALTFDDGPDERYTGRLLDILREAGVPATFFVIGEKALRAPQLVQRMREEGHEVEVHGFRHLPVPLLSPARAMAQVGRTHQLLRDQFGVHTRWYRPPWGLCNAWSLFPAGRAGHRLITWSVMVGDWRLTPPQELRRRILRRLKPGAVIVLHDSDKTWGSQPGAPENVLAMLPSLIEQVRAQGYEFVRLDRWWPKGS